MINEKDILFGIFNHDGKSEIIIDNNPILPQILLGTLSVLAAADETFYLALKSVIDNVDENGDSIRQKFAQAQADGRVVMKDFGERK